MNENVILEEDRRESLSSTNQTVETPTQEEMEWEAFQQLLIQERVEVRRKKIIIDKEVVISSVLKLSGNMSVIQFKGVPEILFLMKNAVFKDFKQMFRVHQRNLVIMACNVANFENQGVFIIFDNSLTINDSILKGFQVYVCCENNGTKLSMNYSIIKSDCQQQQQSVLIHTDNHEEFAMELTNSGGSVIITNSKNVEVTIKDNEFKNQQISISFENVKNKSIAIHKNIFLPVFGICNKND